jgi:hypothetical protein
MKENKYNSMTAFLIVTLDLLMFIGSIACIAIIFKTLSNNGFGNSLQTIVNCVLFFIGTSSLIYILFSLRRILKSVIKLGPFNMSNVKSLKRIAGSCFLIAVCYIINFFFNNQLANFNFISIDSTGIHTDTEFLIFFFVGFFVLVLAQIYKQAVEVKEENDFTI